MKYGDFESLLMKEFDESNFLISSQMGPLDVLTFGVHPQRRNKSQAKKEFWKPAISQSLGVQESNCKLWLHPSPSSIDDNLRTPAGDDDNRKSWIWHMQNGTHMSLAQLCEDSIKSVLANNQD
uniref:Uncharacterized protein n=1 Tax=Cucumis melo TaxID=3656 RepID=A0A9I9EC26_CUCME